MKKVFLAFVIFICLALAILGVGVYYNNLGQKFAVFAISKSEVNFFDFASFFRDEFACVDALNLESGRSVMTIPYTPNSTDNSSSIVCRYLIFDNR